MVAHILPRRCFLVLDLAVLRACLGPSVALGRGACSARPYRACRGVGMGMEWREDEFRACGSVSGRALTCLGCACGAVLVVQEEGRGARDRSIDSKGGKARTHHSKIDKM
jgi:hypothetical protein